MSYVKSNKSRLRANNSGDDEPKQARGAWFAEMVAKVVIESLSRGRMPWLHAEPSKSMGLPVGSSGKPYLGANRICLMISAAQKGFHDPRWSTLAAANQRGERVKPGSKSATIERWIWVAKKKEVDRETGAESVVDVKLATPRVRYFNLFNSQQMKESTPYERPAPVIVSDLIRGLQSGSKTPITHGQGRGYDAASGRISMPVLSASVSSEAYLDGLVRELVKREIDKLGEEGRLKPDVRKSESRGMLRVELACAMFSHEYGIRHDASTMNRFVEEWVDILGAQPRELLHAGRDAGLAFERLQVTLNPEAVVAVESDDEFDAVSVMDEIEAQGFDIDTIEFDELEADEVEIELTGQRSGRSFGM